MLRIPVPVSFLLWTFLLLCVLGLSGVDTRYPQGYFRSPVDIPIALSGTFGEPRTNHFHAGLDIRTNAREGLPVHAAADGYVARIVVSPTGYGNALYVAHPNGYTTVYGHLQRFSPAVAAYVKRLQYAQQRFAIEDFPPPERFPVAKGEEIAKSGNSGSSGGPHLHFEIRDSRTEWPINPALFGLPIADTMPPRLYAVKVYAHTPGSFVVVERTGKAGPSVVTPDRPLVVEAVSQGGAYRLLNVRRLRAAGQVGFGLQVQDYHDTSSLRLGVPTIHLTANGQPLHGYDNRTFSFEQTRYLNAHADYEERERHSRWIHRSFRLPGNPLPLYAMENDGLLAVAPGQTYEMTYTASDWKGNTARLTFEVIGTDEAAPSPPARPPYVAFVDRTQPLTFSRDDLVVRFPEQVFYEDLYLTYRADPATDGAHSRLHVLHTPFTPVHRPFSVSIRADAVPAALRTKALVLRKDSKGKPSSEGGTYEDGYITTQSRSFGTFYVAVDTLPPTITPINLAEGKDLRAAATLQLRIRDTVAGIASYAGYVDGAWVLFAYDPKRNLLYHEFDDRIGPGEHRLDVTVADAVGNTATYTARFRR